MVLRYLFCVTMFFSHVFYAEELDTLLTSLAKTQTTEDTTTPASPATPIAPETSTVVEPKTEPKTVPVEEEPKTIQPKIVVPKAPIAPTPIIQHPVTPEIVNAPTIASATIAKSEPVAEPKVIIQPGEISKVSQQGLDTLHVDSSGNWLEKRIWYQKAEQMFEEIRKTIEKAGNVRMKFVHEVSIIGKSIDDFYEKVLFEKGQIDELLQAVLGSLTTEEKIRGGDLSSSERDIKLKIHENQQDLQSIEINMKMITNLDEQVEKTMIKAFGEIDACRTLENKAWNNFKDIGLELDDKKARTLYYEMENFYKNIQKKIDYLENNLLDYLQQQLNAKITQTISQIQSTMQTLQTKGLNLQTLLAKDSVGDFVILKERDEMLAKQAAAKEMAKKDSKKEPVTKNKWYQNFWCTITEFLCPIFNKLSEWGSIIFCCIKTLLCKIHEFICRIFGY